MDQSFLRQVEYFSDLDDEELKQIRKIMSKQSYQQGEIIFFEGEPGEGLFLLEKGKVKLSKMVESGDEQILTIMKPGDSFAEVVLFDKEEYPATAMAMENSVLWLIKPKEMEELIKKIPSIALKLMGIMSKRLRRAQKLVRDLGLRDTSCRTASLLNYLAMEHGVKQGQKIIINLALTQQELANMIGTTRETISRVLKKFRSQGIIDISRKQIIIKDLKELQKIINL